MKNRFIFLVCLIVILLFNASYVYANSIFIQDSLGSFGIYGWEETNAIDGNNLKMSAVFNGHIIKSNPKYVTLEFNPNEDAGANNLPAEDVLIIVCKGTKSGHNYEDIPIDCSDKIDFYNSSKIRYQNTNYKLYLINISKSNIEEDESFIIKVNYIIPNFVNKGSEKLILLNTDCGETPGTCPSTEITKFLKLPKNVAIRQYPEEAVLENFKGRLIIRLNNFTPIQIRGHSKYENKAVLYTDLDEMTCSQNKSS